MLYDFRDGYNDVTQCLIDLGHDVTFAVVTSAVGKKLIIASQILMKAYIQRGGRVDLHTITFIQKHFDSSMELFDTCVEESPMPLWTCLTIAMVLELAAGASVSQHHLIQPLISTYVERATAIAKLLHHPEEEDR